MFRYLNIATVFLLFSLSCFAQNNDYLKAFALYESEKYEQVLIQLNTLTEKEKNSPDLLILKGKSLTQLKRYDDAINEFLLVEKEKPGIASLELSKVYALKNNPKESIQFLDKHVSSRYKISREDILLDPAFKKIENTKEWEDFWKDDHYSRRENTFSEIEYLIDNKTYFDALDLIDQNLEKSKKNHALYFYRGRVFAKLENPKPAIKNYNKAININKRQAKYYLYRSEAYEKNDKPKKALHDIDKYISLEPTDFSAYRKKTQLLVKLEKYNDVTTTCKSFLELIPEDKEMNMQYALANEKTGNYKQAIETYTKLLEKNKPSADVFFARGNTHLTFEKLKEAIDDYSMSLDLDPTNMEVYFNRGLARFRKGDSQGACSDWKMAAQHGQEQANKNLYYYCK